MTDADTLQDLGIDNLEQAFISQGFIEQICSPDYIQRLNQEWSQFITEDYTIESLYHFLDSARKYLQAGQYNIGENISLLKSRIVRVEEIVTEVIQHQNLRPKSLIETEQTNRHTLKLFIKEFNIEDEELNKLVEMSYKQLGEISYAYGFIIERVEQYIRNGSVTQDEKDFIIDDSWTNFAQGFHGENRKRIMQDFRNSAYAQVYFYQFDKNTGTLGYEAKEFIRGLPSGVINSRAGNLKQVENWSDLRALEIPTNIQIKVDREVYESVYRVYNEQRRKLKGSTGRGFIPTPSELGLMMDKQLKYIKKKPLPEDCTPPEVELFEKLKKTRYRDNMRLFAQEVIRYYHTGKKNRQKTYFDMDLMHLRNIYCPTEKKGKRLYDKLTNVCGLTVHTLYQKTTIPICGFDIYPKEQKIRFYIRENTKQAPK